VRYLGLSEASAKTILRASKAQFGYEQTLAAELSLAYFCFAHEYSLRETPKRVRFDQFRSNADDGPPCRRILSGSNGR
jgi:hypothetical protein